MLTIWGSVRIEETVVGWFSDENLRLLTPGISLVNEAPPMPLRASSHRGAKLALAWYSEMM